MPKGVSRDSSRWIVTLAVDRSGTFYTGAFVADSYDLSNQIIRDFHVAGTVRATRIPVD